MFPTLIAFVLQPWLGRDLVTQWVVGLITDLPWVGSWLGSILSPVVQHTAGTWLLASAALLGWLVASLAAGPAARVLHDRFLLAYDDARLDPIRAAEPGLGSRTGQAMPLQHPAGVWARVWATLAAEVAVDGGLGQMPWWNPRGNPSVPVPFAHILLLGPPGAGKSRLARELARVLGRRATLGSTADSLRHNRWDATRLRFGAWFRRACWWCSRRDDDPWDSGEVDPADPTTLVDWRPARPTVLLLDDPQPGVAIAYLKLLRNRQHEFRYPVRLIVTSQAVPRELAGIGEGEHRPRRTLLLGTNTFGRREVAALAPTMLRRARDLLGTPDQMDRFVHATGGNPFLVELAFDWLLSGEPLETISRDRLLDLRVEGIYRSLDAAGFPVGNMEALRALACGTLVGPGCPLAPVNDAFARQLPSRNVLAHAFPLEAAVFDLAETVPCIRPELVGDRFVRHVIAAQTPRESARAIATAGFRAHPDGWLCAVARLAGDDDALAEALRQEAPIAPDDIALRRRVGEAYLTFAMRRRLEPLAVCDQLMRLVSDVAGVGPRTTLVQLLVRDFQQAVEDDWAEVCASVVAEHEIRRASPNRRSGDGEPLGIVGDPGQEPFRGTAIALLGATLLQLAYGSAGSRLARDLRKDVERLTGEINRRSYFAWDAGADVRFAETLGAIMERYAPDAVNDRASCIAALCRLLVLVSADESAIATCRRGAELLEAITAPAPHSADVALQRERAAAWASLAVVYHHNGDVSRCRAAAAHVEAISSPPAFAGNAALQAERAAAWLQVAHVLSYSDPEGCRASVLRVEMIAAAPSFAASEDLQLQRAEAWAAYAYCLRGARDISGCKAAVARVETITGTPAAANDARLQSVRAAAWRYLAYVLRYSSDGEGCRDAVGRVEDIASRAAFAADHGLQRGRAEAWGYVASLCADAGNITGCQAAVHRVEGITGLVAFATETPLQRQRVQAWGTLANCLSNARDVLGCVNAASHVEAIAGRAVFIADTALQRDRGEAWGDAARVLSDTGDIIGCRAATDRVETIANAPLFVTDADLQCERARARRYLAGALGKVQDVTACRIEVERIEGIASAVAFTADDCLQLERVAAWRVLAYALSEVRDAPGCRTAAEHVEAIAGLAAFASDVRFQEERATAWRHLAFACSHIGDVQGCHVAVARVEAIASSSGVIDHVSLQDVRVMAWRHLAFAWYKAGHADGCRTLAAHVDAIASRLTFADDERIQLERATVWRLLACTLAAQQDSIGAQQAFSHVYSIAARFPACGDLQQEVADALRCAGGSVRIAISGQ